MCLIKLSVFFFFFLIFRSREVKICARTGLRLLCVFVLLVCLGICVGWVGEGLRRCNYFLSICVSVSVSVCLQVNLLDLTFLLCGRLFSGGK